MAYSEKFKAKVKSEYEAGVLPILTIAQKYSISRNTLKKFAKKGAWEYGKNDHEVTSRIEKRTTDKLTKEYSEDLENFTKEHLGAMDNIAKLTKATIARMGKAVNETKNNLDRNESEAMFSQQKVLKIASETLTGIYNDKRKALGLDKEDKTGQNVTVNTTPPIIEIIGIESKNDKDKD